MSKKLCLSELSSICQEHNEVEIIWRLVLVRRVYIVVAPGLFLPAEFGWTDSTVGIMSCETFAKELQLQRPK